MAEFIPSVSFTDWKKIAKDVNTLKQLKSCEVTFNGEHLFTFINPQTDYIRLHSEQLANLSNQIFGKDPVELLTDAALPV